MKKLLSATLLILLCATSSKVTAQNDSIPSPSDLLRLGSFEPGEIQFSEAPPPEHIWFLKSAIVNYKPLVLQPEQVFNVYVGLQQGEAYKKRFREAQAAIVEQDNLIQDQNEEIKSYAREEIESAKALAKLNADLLKKSEEIQVLKDKKSKWYKSPFLYAGLGLVAGVYIAK